MAPKTSLKYSSGGFADLSSRYLQKHTFAAYLTRESHCLSSFGARIIFNHIINNLNKLHRRKFVLQGRVTEAFEISCVARA